jgi:hypothetical protein
MSLIHASWIPNLEASVQLHLFNLVILPFCQLLASGKTPYWSFPFLKGHNVLKYVFLSSIAF